MPQNKFIRNLLKAFITPLAYVYRLARPRLWLFSSRPDEVDGNALALFEWAKDKQDCVYVLSRKAPQYRPDMIQWGGFRHLLLSAVARVHITDIGNADFYGRKVRRFTGLKTKNVFLQHGVTRCSIPFYWFERTGFDLVLATSERECRFLTEEFGYPESRLALTGFPRHDDLIRNVSDRGYILVLPTWRNYLRNMSKEEFKADDFFVRLQSLLQNPALAAFLKSNNLKLCFKLHYMIRDKLPLFALPDEGVAYDAPYSIRELLRDCSMLITDESSVAFDAALAGKPVVYYRFEEGQYDLSTSYFQLERDGFGPVIGDEQELVDYVCGIWDGKRLVREPEYTQRADEFFAFKDADNCQRTYDAILKMLDGK